MTSFLKVVLCKCFMKNIFPNNFNVNLEVKRQLFTNYFFFLRGAAGGFEGCSLVSTFSTFSSFSTFSPSTPAADISSFFPPPLAGGSLVLSLPLSSSTCIVLHWQMNILLHLQVNSFEQELNTISANKNITPHGGKVEERFQQHLGRWRSYSTLWAGWNKISTCSFLYPCLWSTYQCRLAPPP